MYWSINIFVILIVSLVIVFGCFETGVTQSTKQQPDTTATVIKADSLNKNNELNEGQNIEREIILSEINIEAIVEKPRVAILPKRVEPEFGEIQFINRSFESELKAVPQKSMILDNRLFVPQKIESYKQLLLRKKKEFEKK